jgi:hypothetical protein
MIYKSWKDNIDTDFAKFGDELEEILKAPEVLITHEAVIAYLQSMKGKIVLTPSYEPACSKLLDVGERNPLTIKIENELETTVDSTDGDLDIAFTTPNQNYMTVVMSHVIEHLFNPLFCLMELRKRMVVGGNLIIATPWCSENLKLRFTNGHFHEIDEKRMSKLFHRAGFMLVNKFYYRRMGGGFNGIRPLIRLIQQKNVIYHCVKIGEIDGA